MDQKIRTIYAAPPNKRHEYVRKATMVGAMPPVLFLYLESDFQLHPNKKKAIFLFEYFLYHICHNTLMGMGVPADGLLSINMEVKPGVVEALRGSFEQIDRDRTKAKKMNIFKRISSSKDRKSADKNVFNAFRHALLEDHNGMEGPWSSILSKGGIEAITKANSQTIFQNDMRTLQGLQGEISKCGFDVKYTGVAPWAVNFEELGL